MAEDTQLKDTVARLGLPEGTTWNQVNDHLDLLQMQATASSLGLPNGATWADINEHNGRLMQPKHAEAGSDNRAQQHHDTSYLAHEAAQFTSRNDGNNWAASLGSRSGRSKE